MKRESELKAAFKRELKRQLPGFYALAYATAGAPDLSIIGNGRQTNWELKHATPSFVSHGIQELFCMRLAEAGHCRYVIWLQGAENQTLIVPPKMVYEGNYIYGAEARRHGFDHEWLVEQVKKAHGLMNNSDNHIDLSNLPSGTYVSMAEVGDCRVCGKREDLRMGACYDCADQVDGRQVAGGHELWDSKNPTNRWFVRVQ